MARFKRKVSFYRLVLDKQIDDISVSLSNERIEESFWNIYNNKMSILADGHRAINIQIGSGDYVIEVIECREHLVLAKIGRQNSADTVALRDQDTLESAEVPMSDTQTLELYTYFLTDFTTGIISYIGIGGIPKISAIRGLYDTNLYEEGITSRVSAIMTKDILQMVARKQVISLIEMTVSVPSDQVLNSIISDGNQFDALRNIKSHTMTFKLVAEKSKNIFSNSSKLSELFNMAIDKFGDKMQKFTVRAKDQGEDTQPYNLLSYCFTKTVDLITNNRSELTVDDYRAALYQTYNTMRDELLRYVRV